jgi:HD-like signal output (HDOD) protein
LAVGAQAQRIGRAENAGYKLVSECFVGGMLHDTGKLVLASRFPAQYAQAVEQSQQKKIRLWQAEQEVFGATHADVGGYVLGLWGLPVPVVEAVALHHSPTKSFAVGFTPLTAVHVANALVQEKRRTAEGISSLQVDSMYLTELGLLGRLPRWRNTVQ